MSLEICKMYPGQFSARTMLMDHRYCPPKLKQIAFIWALFSLLGEFGSDGRIGSAMSSPMANVCEITGAMIGGGL